jgi:hypothetical protein
MLSLYLCQIELEVLDFKTLTNTVLVLLQRLSATRSSRRPNEPKQRMPLRWSNVGPALIELDPGTMRASPPITALVI